MAISKKKLQELIAHPPKDSDKLLDHLRNIVSQVQKLPHKDKSKDELRISQD